MAGRRRHTLGHALALLALAFAVVVAIGSCGEERGEGHERRVVLANPWVTPFAASRRPPRVRPDSAKIVADLVTQRKYGMGVEQAAWTMPLYVVRTTDDLPWRRIRLSGQRRADPRKGASHSAEVLNFLLQRGVKGKGWPIPDDAVADPSATGADGYFAVLVADTHQYAELNNARRAPNGDWIADWGGYIHDVRHDRGHYRDHFVRSLSWSHHGWGANGSSLPMYAGIIREHEVRAAMAAWERGDHDRAVIPHALGLNTHGHTQYSWTWPAQRTDCYGKGGCTFVPSPIEMGQTFRFPPDFDPRTVTGPTPRDTALLQIVARTMRDYGAIVWDASGGGFKLRAELVPEGQRFDYGNSPEWLKALPLDRLQVVETRGRRGYRPFVPRSEARAAIKELIR